MFLYGDLVHPLLLPPGLAWCEKKAVHSSSSSSAGGNSHGGSGGGDKGGGEDLLAKSGSVGEGEEPHSPSSSHDEATVALLEDGQVRRSDATLSPRR